VITFNFLVVPFLVLDHEDNIRLESERCGSIKHRCELKIDFMTPGDVESPL